MGTPPARSTSSPKRSLTVALRMSTPSVITSRVIDVMTTNPDRPGMRAPLLPRSGKRVLRSDRKAIYRDGRSTMSRSLEPTQSIGARGDVAVWDVGEGEPVLLMHGFPDHAIGLLDAAERFAAEGYRAIVVSYPGYWPSSPAPDGDYSMAAVAGDIVQVLDALELPSVHVFGHGWGALYGYWLASRLPARIGRLVALAAPHPIGFRVRRRILGEQQTAVYALLLAYS